MFNMIPHPGQQFNSFASVAAKFLPIIPERIQKAINRVLFRPCRISLGLQCAVKVLTVKGPISKLQALVAQGLQNPGKLTLPTKKM